MTPQPPPLLDELWESIPTGPAPAEALVARGRARQRHRRLGFAGGAAALVIATVVTVSMAPWSHGDQDHVLAPPPGMQYVGIGQVVVAVPEAWPVESGPCPPLRTSVYFPYPADWICPSPSRQDVSSVAISAVRMNDGFVDGMTPDGRVEGHQVVARPNPAICMPGEGPEACLQSFGVPDLHAYFSVRVPRDEPGALDEVKAIRESLRVLPKGQTTVSFVSPLSPLDKLKSALSDAGLTARVVHHSCPSTGNCGPGVISTTPAPGTVVRTGSIVTIDVQD
jgi:hypothetical protein